MSTWIQNNIVNPKRETKMEDIKELEEMFKKRWHKRVDRDIWWHRYFMAIAEIHNIEGMIGLRVEDNTLYDDLCEVNKLCKVTLTKQKDK
jgi:hypothetical protein